MEKFKIAIYSGEIPPPTFIDRLINGLAEYENEVLLVGNLTKKVSYKSTNIKVIGYSGRISKFWILLKYSLLLYFYKKEEKIKLDHWLTKNRKNSIISRVRYYPILYHKPDIFHLQWAKSVADWVWVKDFNIKFIVSLRGAHINYTPICEPHYANLYRKYFPSVDFFHGVSKEIILEAAKYKADTNKSQVVYSGLKLENIQLTPAKTLNNELQILSIGRSHWKKGYRYALDSMRILKDRNIQFNYTIVGVENDEELLFQVAQLGLTKEVQFIDKLPFNKVLQQIQKANLLLLPSVEEGIANVVLEAMALGTVVVSTDCGGMSEVIVNEKTGFLVPIRNPEAMAEAIYSVVKLNTVQYTEMIINARQFIEKNHSNEKMVQDMITLYQKSYDE